MGIWNSLKSFFGYETVTVRAKNAKGRFVADDPTPPDVNEAWEGGEAPKKTTAKKKTTKKKTTKKASS